MQASERNRLGRQDGRHQLRGNVAGEGGAAGEHLVQDHAERKDVATLVHRLTINLLRRHVLQRSGNRTQADERRPRRIADDLDPGQLPGEPEVEQFDSRTGQHHVPRLQIAMHESLLVGVGEAVGDLAGNVDRVVHRKAAAGHAAGQRFAVEMFHQAFTIALTFWTAATTH